MAGRALGSGRDQLDSSEALAVLDSLGWLVRSVRALSPGPAACAPAPLVCRSDGHAEECSSCLLRSAEGQQEQSACLAGVVAARESEQGDPAESAAQGVCSSG